MFTVTTDHLILGLVANELAKHAYSIYSNLNAADDSEAETTFTYHSVNDPFQHESPLVSEVVFEHYSSI